MKSARRLVPCTTGLAAIALAALVLIACDDSPTDGGEPAAGITIDGLIAANRPQAPSDGGLLRLTLDRAERRWGANAADVLAAAVEERRSAARAMLFSGDTAGARLASDQLRNAEAALAVRVFGSRVADEALRVVRTEWGWLDRRIDAIERAGFDVAGSRAWSNALNGFAERADQANDASNPALALLLAMQAAAAFDSSRQILARTETRSLDGLEDLFAPLATGAADGAEPADELRAARLRALAAADSATSRGSTDDAYTELAKARDAEARIVAGALGRAGVAAYVDSVEAGIRRIRDALATLDQKDAASRRLVRMLDTAASLGARAATSLRAGRDAEAVDLAAHAADLVNTALRGVARPD